MAQEANNKMNELIARALSDEALKAKLIEDPLNVFKAEGIDVPAGLEIKVLENTDKVFHLVLPAQPSELSDEDLDQVAGGIVVQCDVSNW